MGNVLINSLGINLSKHILKWYVGKNMYSYT